MKKFSGSLLVLVLAFIFSGCDHVDPGYVGIKVISCGDGQGIDPNPVGVGYYAVGACTSYIVYPTFVQTVVWTHNTSEGNPTNEEITFNNADKMTIAADISLAYQLEPEKAPAFYSRFRADKLQSFTDGFMRNLAREKFDEVAGKYKIESIMGDNAKFLSDVRASLQKDLDPYGIKLQQFGFIGAPRPPQAVIDAINATTHATQVALQIQNELAQSTAQAKKQVALAEGEASAMIAKAKGIAEARKIESEAEAQANKRLSESVSPALIEYKKVMRWNGTLSQVSSATPIVNLK